MRARQQPAPQATFRTATDLVQVDAYVLDKNRKPVRGLTAADFTVLEDGKPRPIVAFTPVDLPEAAPVAAPWLHDVAPDAVVATNDQPRDGRLVLIVFDWSIRPEDQPVARKIASAAVDALGPNDLATVLFTNQYSNAGIPQNFTADRPRLREAIKRPFAAALVQTDSRSGEGLLLDPKGFETGDCFCRLCVPEAIARIADVVRDLPRRKVMLFVGTYFRGYAPISDICASQLKVARTMMERATGLANLTIDVLDPVGLTPGQGPVPGRPRERLDNLQLLADATGGRLVANTNAPEAQVPAIFAESASYYLLGFVPAEPGSTGIRRIEVKVKRPGVSVRSREGYDPKATSVAARPAASPEAAVGGLMARSDLSLSLAAAPFAVPGQPLAVLTLALGVHRPGAASDAPATSDATPGPLEIKSLIAALDAKAKPVDSRTQIVRITDPSHDFVSGSFDLLSQIDLKPGHYEIRVATDAGTPQQGSVYAYVDIPDFSKDPLSLSGVVLSLSSAPAAPPDALAGVLPVVPTATRTFARTDHATAYLRLYQGGSGPVAPVQLAVRVVDVHEQRRLDQHMTLAADRFTTNRAAAYQFDLPLARLADGDYLLTLEATLDKRVVRQDVRFAVK